MSQSPAMTRSYQLRYSEQQPLMSDEGSRKKKAQKILAILDDALGGRDPKTLRLLDVGSSAGIILSELAQRFGTVIGVDIDEAGLSLAKRYAPENESLVLGDAMSMPFGDETFDVVILNHVYEHVPDPARLVDESWRVVRPDGLVYFAADNRFGPIEPHHRLPLLSWFPREIAHLYLRVTGKGDHYYEQLASLPSLRRLVARFAVDDYTMKVITDPSRFAADDMLGRGSLLSKLPRALLAILYPFSPSYLWLLRK